LATILVELQDYVKQGAEVSGCVRCANSLRKELMLPLILGGATLQRCDKRSESEMFAQPWKSGPSEPALSLPKGPRKLL
jgi:hypothetical protein